MKKVNYSPLRYIKILWHEGTGEFNGKEYTSFEYLQNDFKSIFDKETVCYSKVKLQLHWEDATSKTFRIDIGTGEDYNPYETDLKACILLECPSLLIEMLSFSSDLVAQP
jgi:hypothetical protein